MKISEAESRIMDVLWEKSPRTADDIAEIVGPTQSWTMATVKTLLNRLMKKEAISAEKQGRKFHYSPLLSAEAYKRAESQSFLDRMFDGKFSSMVTHFSSSQDLSADDVSALKDILKRLEDDQ